ncbi:MAG: FtsX-like permease family protein [Thermodesulfovibrionales bacterium]|nr:FtsX-like permease family protein [Thermodesulfovibrionales bacterium]
MKFLKLVRLFVLRNLREEKFLTFLSITGIALGIGLFVGVKVASDRAIASFEADIRGVQPATNYEIFDISGIEFDEGVYRDVRSVADDCFPLIKTSGYVPSSGDTIDLNGIYTVKALSVLKFTAVQSKNFEKFYREINGVLITKKFSEKHALKKGDTFIPVLYDREYPLKVIDILHTDRLPANTVIMDIGNYQEYLGKTGRITRIDLDTDEESAGRIQGILPQNLKIERVDEVIQNQRGLVASFRYNLQFLSLIAILVGIFLLYNTVFISVLKRRTEIGILRGLGTGRKTVMALFILQGLILGTIGSVFGIALGQLAAYFSISAVGKTLSTMYSAVSISDYFITSHDAFFALSTGLFVSVLASAIPAYESSKIRPTESAREGSFEGRYRKYQKWFAAAGLFSILLGTAVAYIDYYAMPFAFPVLAYLGILFLIIGFAFASPLCLTLFLKLMKKPAQIIFGITANITIGDMNGNIYRFAVALMTVAISCALIIALFTLIFSFRDSLKAWINKNIVADVYIKPASCKANYCFTPMSEDIITTVKEYSEVAGVDKFRGLHLDLFGKKVIAGFADIEVKRKYSGKRYFDTEYTGVLREMEGSEPVAGISDYLGIQYGLGKGDRFELMTPAGKQSFRINDVFASYSTTSGFLYLDRKWLKKYWGLDDATQISVYVKDGVEVEEFIRKLRERLSTNYTLEVMNNHELRMKIMGIFNKTFAITYAIELISILVSLIGVVNTLLALVFERKREISIMRYIGASWKQLRQMFVLSAGFIGIVGIFLGSLMGPMMSMVFIYVVNKISFGWYIQFHVPYLYLSVVLLLLFLTTLAAGLLPSKVAQKIDPKRFISFE